VRREARLVTGNFFSLLGVSAERGRAFGPADDELGSAPVIVLSHRAWKQHYASDPAVLGRTYRVNGTQFEVVGVMPDGFRGLEIVAPDFWVPLAQTATFDQPVVRALMVSAVSRSGRSRARRHDGQAQGGYRVGPAPRGRTWRR
jgi:hypothetical protein